MRFLLLDNLSGSMIYSNIFQSFIFLLFLTDLQLSEVRNVTNFICKILDRPFVC